MVSSSSGTKIFTAKTMHKRLAPKVNKFVYSVYYLAFPLSKIDELKLLWPLISFKSKDHGLRDGSDLKDWIYDILKKQEVSGIDEVVLVSMPRVLGYAFNPVSFWLCLDKGGELRAVLSEVNNTFGETHSYLCAHNDGSVISADDTFAGEKLFHVSPFLEREGSYQFRFDYSADRLGIWIDYYNEQGEKVLLTNLIGGMSELTRPNLLKHFFKYPMVTLKVIVLIHYQALKLVSKGIKYITKPKQKESRSSKITKM